MWATWSTRSKTINKSNKANEEAQAHFDEKQQKGAVWGGNGFRCSRGGVAQVGHMWLVAHFRIIRARHALPRYRARTEIVHQAGRKVSGEFENACSTLDKC